MIVALHALAVVSSELGAVSLYDFLSLRGAEFGVTSPPLFLVSQLLVLSRRTWCMSRS
jgi:hypothetical protein